MKKIFIAFLLIFVSNYSFAQQGTMVTFPTEDGKEGSAYYVPSDMPTKRILIIFHEWWGLNDHIKLEAEKWQQKLCNANVYAIDLYDGVVTASPDSAAMLKSNLNAKRAEAIIKGCLKRIGKDNKIATLGWCMGGSWSFAAALLADEDAVACLMYYGEPEKNLTKIKTLKSDVMYVYGTRDKQIKKVDVDAFGKRISVLGYKFDLHSFNAEHAFANPSNPNYNKMATAEANEYALKFLQQHLCKQN